MDMWGYGYEGKSSPLWGIWEWKVLLVFVNVYFWGLDVII